MDRKKILDAVIDAVAEAYSVDKSTLSEATEYKKTGAYSSSKVLKTALFIGENLDLDDDLSYEDIANHVTIGDTVDMLKKKLG
jgi:hypothetical protein